MNSKIFSFSMMFIVMAGMGILADVITGQETSMLPLAETGPYIVGERSLSLVDESREDRQVDLKLWYPAVVPEDSTVNVAALERMNRGIQNGLPDMSEAPYPLILVSHGMGSYYELPQFTAPLAAKGYVVVAINHQDDSRVTSAIDRPLDIVFVLDQLTAITEPDLAGFIDSNNAGVLGWSYGAYTALAMTGAQIDPASAQALAADPFTGDVTDPRFFWSDWDWVDLVTYRAQFSPPLANQGLWPAFHDERIRAVVAASPCFAGYFGEQGLASATVSILLVAGTADQFCPYENNAVFDYSSLGFEERYLLTLIDGDHDSPTNAANTRTLQHITAAFFGYYLQEREEYSQYLTSEYVDNLETEVDLGLVWGIYE